MSSSFRPFVSSHSRYSLSLDPTKHLSLSSVGGVSSPFPLSRSTSSFHSDPLPSQACFSFFPVLAPSQKSIQHYLHPKLYLTSWSTGSHLFLWEWRTLPYTMESCHLDLQHLKLGLSGKANPLSQSLCILALLPGCVGTAHATELRNHPLDWYLESSDW